MEKHEHNGGLVRFGFVVTFDQTDESGICELKKFGTNGNKRTTLPKMGTKPLELHSAVFPLMPLESVQ